MRVLVTGSVGFIGYRIARALPGRGGEAVGLDVVNDDYGYASSSSVYGANTTMPFSVHHNVDHSLSLDAAIKQANALMAHTYSHSCGSPTTSLGFYTVYGPWGRPEDVTATYAVVEELSTDVGLSPSTPIEAGLERFVSWYREYCRV